jgi:hypothetical protein
MSCQMDTSVPTSYGRVINLPLAAQQQNMSLISAVLFIGGIILYATSKPMQSLSGSGSDEDPALQHAIFLEKKITSTLLFVLNDLAGMSFKRILAHLGSALALFILLVIVGINTQISLIVALVLSYLLMRRENRI